MGTRHITKIIDTKGETVVSSYGQWDGYPMGQGLDIIEMLNQQGLIANLDSNIDSIKTLRTDEEIVTLLEANGFTQNENGMVSMDESEKRKIAIPQIHRDTGSKIINLIATNPGIETVFTEDSSWCEYVNTINLQTRVFEIDDLSGNPPIFTTSIDNPMTVEAYKSHFDD